MNQVTKYHYLSLICALFFLSSSNLSASPSVDLVINLPKNILHNEPTANPPNDLPVHTQDAYPPQENDRLPPHPRRPHPSLPPRHPQRSYKQHYPHRPLLSPRQRRSRSPLQRRWSRLRFHYHGKTPLPLPLISQERGKGWHTSLCFSPISVRHELTISQHPGIKRPPSVRVPSAPRRDLVGTSTFSVNPRGEWILRAMQCDKCTSGTIKGFYGLDLVQCTMHDCEDGKDGTPCGFASC